MWEKTQLQTEDVIFYKLESLKKTVRVKKICDLKLNQIWSKSNSLKTLNYAKYPIENDACYHRTCYPLVLIESEKKIFRNETDCWSCVRIAVKFSTWLNSNCSVVKRNSVGSSKYKIKC